MSSRDSCDSTRSIAAKPEDTTTAPAPPSSLARVSASNVRVGMLVRVYSCGPLRPKPGHVKVLDRQIGGVTAPKLSSVAMPFAAATVFRFVDSDMTFGDFR